ncbi:MAG: hypothetical protein IKX54_00825 [Lachnospiraceae bacterium]|nr:hypothetical protein [Lachnospiraceae bacterium]
MLIAVWSPAYRSETAPIAVLVAGMCCRQFPIRVALLENYVHAGNLGYHLLGSRYDAIRNSVNPDFSGSYLPGEMFLRHVCHETNRSSRYGSVIQVDGNGVMFLPMNQSLSASAYRYGMHAVLDQRVEFLQELFDDVFVHLEPNENDTTVEMLARADVVMVCLPATITAFSGFYDRYRSMVDKCFFVFYGASGSPEPTLLKLQKLLPRHTMRCCYLEITRLLAKYIEEGRSLDYLDRFAMSPGAFRVFTGGVAEERAEYRPAGAYAEWQAAFAARMRGHERSGDNAQYAENGTKEQDTIRSIRYVSEWLMQREYPDAHGDCVLIAERMMRRRILPREVAEWEMMKFGGRTAKEE